MVRKPGSPSARPRSKGLSDLRIRPEEVTMASLQALKAFSSGVQGGGPSSLHGKFPRTCCESRSRSSKRGIVNLQITSPAQKGDCRPLELYITLAAGCCLLVDTV